MSNDKKYMILNKNNLMVKARYNLTSKENKIYLFILYNIQMKLLYEDKDDELLTCTIKRSEFSKVLTDIRDRGAVSISKMLSSIRTKPLFFIKEDLEGNKIWGEYGFISSYTYNKKEDVFSIKIEKKVLELLKEYMGDGYTPLNLAIMFSLEGFYSQRVYELIRMWSNTKNIIDYRLDTIKDYLMLDLKKSYNLYANVKNKVIEPAIKEINESGYIKVSYDEIKEGRKVAILRFKVKDLDKRIYFSEKVIDEECIEEKSKIDNKLIVKEIHEELYIPDETVFSKGTLRSFKKDFKDIDFKNDYMERAFEDAVMITLDRDNIETIKATSYKFFKGTLKNKIIEYKKEEELDIKDKEETEIFW